MNNKLSKTKTILFINKLIDINNSLIKILDPKLSKHLIDAQIRANDDLKRVLDVIYSGAWDA